MPRRIEPFTFFTYRIAVIIKPINARSAQIPNVWKLPLKFTYVRSVESLFTIICAPCKPTKAIKIPIPALTPFFNVLGIALKIASRTLVSESAIKTIPSAKTAISATLQSYPIAPHTVYAKYAFSPIPGASANG